MEIFQFLSQEKETVNIKFKESLWPFDVIPGSSK